MYQDFAIIEKSANHIVQATSQMETVIVELSASLLLISNKEQQSLQEAITVVSSSLEKSSKIYKEIGGKLELLVYDPLKEYSLYFLNILTSLKAREDIAEALFKAKTDLHQAKSKRTNVKRVFKVLKNRQRNR